MTGHQENPGSGRNLQGDIAEALKIEDILAAYGYKNIYIVDPQDLEAMEQAVAALVLDMEGREAAVKSVTRGDTSVTYAVADGQAAALAGLAPWRRLGRLKEG